ncbi:PREDICTED: uncharacterized protein LOC107093487 isoform X2 [Cyprinodon variegatus]|uniref:uncharacterized protein LOC107093487 isoform X2 n=2 Tax=Cyprinodon variegatus TaxID=28743 RepID=UPI00074286C3|nr:PREDICTED: uncharacterized protein LOC107093487 isoform X2 [Cyprinodon variegatus]
MAAQCAKCLAERKGFRRELDSWRHKLVHCVGLETILEEIYGPMLLRDLNLCCEPKKVDDWSAEASVSHCSFCNLPLDKLSDQVPATVSPLSSPSDYSPCQTSTTSESSQSAHKFLQAVFHKKDVTLDCDPKIPLVAQELMNKIIHQFAEEYASKCLLPTTTNGITRPSSPLSETSDAPLDLTVNRTNCVLDLSNRNSASSAISTSNHSASGFSLPSVTQRGVVGQRETKLHQPSTLDAILHSLCSTHKSLLYQILKFALQEKLPPFHNLRSIDHTESQCRRCGVNQEVDLTSHYIPSNESNTPKSKRMMAADCVKIPRLKQLQLSLSRTEGERSPSPPHLLPITHDRISKNTHGKPPLLTNQTHSEEAEPNVKNCHSGHDYTTAGVDADAEIGHYQPEQNPGRSLLQDVVSHFNHKIESIKPLDKDSVSALGSSELPKYSTIQSFHPDAHLEEIIRTVLHTGSASEDSFNDQFNLHCNKESKSPNTRSRRRREIQEAIATPADDACARRKIVAEKRKLATFCLPYNRGKGTPSKRIKLKEENYSLDTPITSSEQDLIKEACGKKVARIKLVKNHEIAKGTPCTISTKSERDKAEEEIKAMIVTDKLQTIKKERKDGFTISKTKHLCGQLCKDDVQTQTVSMNPILVTGSGWSRENATACSPVNEGNNCKLDQSSGVRKSTRNIVPPPRFSSYFVSHAPVYNPSRVEIKGTQETESKANLYTQKCIGNLTFESTAEEPPEPTGTQSKGECQISPKTFSIEKEHYNMNSPVKEKDNVDGSSNGKQRSSERLKALKMLQNSPNDCSPLNNKVQYVSPIKLMYVYPVKDNEGVYSLKSADSNSQTEVAFDPCVESSWSGTPQKNKSHSKEHAVSPLKQSPSPAKAGISHTSSPANSPKRQTSPRSTASSPKPSPRTSGGGTLSRRLSETEDQRSPCKLVFPCETTPPKRRPGRPRKLGPQLEQKVKRPIGRPRKQKQENSVAGSKSPIGKCATTVTEDNIKKNLKITVVYGRSRRNKRVVSEVINHLQSDSNNTYQAVDIQSELGILLHCSSSSGIMKLFPEEFSFVGPAKEPEPQSGSTIKTQKQNESATSRKPGRPAKIKISGISVTVTATSPRRRQIQINRETRISPKKQLSQNKIPPESAKELCKSNTQLPITSNQTDLMETKNGKEHKLPNQNVALRHSERERKPSIHFLHAVATSSYKCSNALLRRSKQHLINKTSNERRQEDKQGRAETKLLKRRPCKREREKITQDLNKVSKVSLDSIFSPRKPVLWWAASAKEKPMNQELARRIRVISDTWVANAANNRDKVVHNSNLDSNTKSPDTNKSKESSVVRALFDCPPNEPRSCSMQQICSWFMQTTETQSLAIKKASSPNPFEIMHFPRSANKNTVCNSPQAERLRKHLKKFAKTIPKTPLQHQQAQLHQMKKQKAYLRRRRLFAMGKLNRGVMWRSSLSAQFRAILFRMRRRFLALKEKMRLKNCKGKKVNKRKMVYSNRPIATVRQSNQEALHRSVKRQLSESLQKSSTCAVDQTLKHAVVNKEQKLSSKAWSPEKLKECRVFLRKINSPDNESTEGDSCTVTLDNGSLSTDLFEGKEKDLEGVDKAVRNERKSSNSKTCSRKLSNSALVSVLKGKQRGKQKQSGEISPAIVQPPPPAKVLRQSRVRGFTGPRWCDYVFEISPK